MSAEWIPRPGETVWLPRDRTTALILRLIGRRGGVVARVAPEGGAVCEVPLHAMRSLDDMRNGHIR